MLRLHEEILLQVKISVTPFEGKPDASTEAQKRSKHIRWLSYENFEGLVPGRARSSARRSLEVPWFRRSKSYPGTTSPGEVADVARVFEHKV